MPSDSSPLIHLAAIGRFQRKAADAHRLVKTGVVGLLIRAKREGKVASLQGALDRLREKAGLWIAESLYQAALKTVGAASGARITCTARWRAAGGQSGGPPKTALQVVKDQRLLKRAFPAPAGADVRH